MRKRGAKTLRERPGIRSDRPLGRHNASDTTHYLLPLADDAVHCHEITKARNKFSFRGFVFSWLIAVLAQLARSLEEPLTDENRVVRLNEIGQLGVDFLAPAVVHADNFHSAIRSALAQAAGERDRLEHGHS